MTGLYEGVLDVNDINVCYANSNSEHCIDKPDLILYLQSNYGDNGLGNERRGDRIGTNIQ